MKKTKNFNFKKARRISSNEVKTFRKAIEEKLKTKRPSRGRPPKKDDDRFEAVSIRLHPSVLKWVKKEAKKQGIGYQTLINQILLKKAVA